MVWISLPLIVFGGFVSAMNWASPIASRVRRRNVSALPIVGALMLGSGLYLLPATRAYAWMAIVADYGTLKLVFALPWIAAQMWDKSGINHVRTLKSDVGGRRFTVTLYRSGTAIIAGRLSPPIPGAPRRSRVESFSTTGRWTPMASGFTITGYGKDRRLDVVANDHGFTTVETREPPANGDTYDDLNGLTLHQM